MEQVRREQLLDVGKGQIREAAEKLQRDVVERGNFVLLGKKKEFIKAGEWREEDLGVAGKVSGAVEDAAEVSAQQAAKV